LLAWVGLGHGLRPGLGLTFDLLLSSLGLWEPGKEGAGIVRTGEGLGVLVGAGDGIRRVGDVGA